MHGIFFPKTLVIGVGLIGGSLVLSLKKHALTKEVVGFDTDMANARVALEMGMIDSIGNDLEREVTTADLIILAVPVRQMAPTMAAIAPFLRDSAIIIDVGSTKTSVIDAARQTLGNKIGLFVPCHPIAGAEKNGAVAAWADIFVDHQLVITPLPENTDETVEKVRYLWESCGACITLMPAEKHDQFFAAISHLPHFLSYALVYEINRRENGNEFFSFAAGGFRDFSRIAASSPAMWRDIFLANKTALLKEITAYQTVLDELKDCLIKEDGDRLTEIFEASRTARTDWALKKRW